jgi:ADP-ribose pyrophosphatase YjhB (NUDIX family)
VEVGERAAEALAREWREELGLELEAGELIGIVENLYTYQGVPGHEICLVFSARLFDETVYARDEFECVEPSGLRHAALWVSLDELRGGAIAFYPRGLLELLGDEPRSIPHSTWSSAP